MSRENVEVVRELLGGETSFEIAGDTSFAQEFVDRLAPDVEYREDPRFPEAGTYRGRDEVRRYWLQFVAQFDRYVLTVEDIIDAADDAVLVCLHLEGRGTGGGAEFEARAGWVYTVRDGQVVRITAYLDRAEAFEAVGLPPQ